MERDRVDPARLLMTQAKINYPKPKATITNSNADIRSFKRKDGGLNMAQAASISS